MCAHCACMCVQRGGETLCQDGWRQLHSKLTNLNNAGAGHNHQLWITKPCNVYGSVSLQILVEMRKNFGTPTLSMSTKRGEVLSNKWYKCKWHCWHRWCNFWIMIDRARQPPATDSPSPSPSYLMHILWWWLFTPRQSERLQEKTVLVTLHYATVQFAWYVNNSFAIKQPCYKIQRKGLFHRIHLSDIKWTCTLPA